MISKLSYYLYLLAGFVSIIYICYIRLILVRLPKELFLNLNNNINFALLLIIIIGIIISLSVISVNLYLLFNLQIKQNFVNRAFSTIQEYFNRAFFEVYKLIINLIPQKYDKIPLLVKNFYNIFGNRAEETFVIIVYIIRFIIVISFLIDIFLFFRFNYFYKALTLLLIPICVNVLFFILTDYSKNLGELQASLVIKNGEFDKNGEVTSIEYSLTPENKGLNLNYIVEQYKLCLALSQYLLYYNMVLRYVSIRGNLLIYCLYLLGWLFILYKNFTFYM